MVARMICYFLGHIVGIEDVRPGHSVRCARCKTRMFVLPAEIDPDTIDDCPHPHRRDE